MESAEAFEIPEDPYEAYKKLTLLISSWWT